MLKKYEPLEKQVEATVSSGTNRQKVFFAIDTNGNGILSLEEVGQYLESKASALTVAGAYIRALKVYLACVCICV